jgi:hypothetical protein
MENIMNNSKHTPGPWYLLPSRTLTNVKGFQGEQICQLNINSPDAALIAAAPEMLEALETMIKHCAGQASINDPDMTIAEDIAVQNALKAIQKANGGA